MLRILFLGIISLLLLGLEKNQSKEAVTVTNACSPSHLWCYADTQTSSGYTTCVIDYLQNTGYFVIWVDCGNERLRIEETGCIGPSLYGVCTSPLEAF